MQFPKIEAGRVYRLRRDFEVRDEKTGTLKDILRKGWELKVKQVKSEEGRVWVEGVALPLPEEPLRRAVDPVL
jgi:hypothetical protein